MYNQETYTVLVADDSPTLLEIVSEQLIDEGYHVITADNGIEAIEKIYATPPNLVILDIIMPKMDGHQVCRVLKNDPLLQHIPVIMLTGKEQQKNRFWSLSTGADDFFVKEEGLEKLIVSVNYLIERKKGTKADYRKTTFMNEVELYKHLSKILDKKLFESTIAHEFHNRISPLKPLQEAFWTTFMLLSDLCDIYGICWCFESLSNYRLVCVCPGQKENDRCENKCLVIEDMLRKPEMCLSDDDINSKYIVPTKKQKQAKYTSKDLTTITVPMYLRNQYYGMMSCTIPISSTAIEHTKRIINVFSNEIPYVFNECMLYQQLRETNNHLQTTLRELQEAQMRLIQSEKMALMGHLIASITHEINTPVGAIRSGVNNIKESMYLIMNMTTELIAQGLTPNEASHITRKIAGYINEPPVEKAISTKEQRILRKKVEQFLDKYNLSQADMYARDIVRLHFQEKLQDLIPLLESPRKNLAVGIFINMMRFRKAVSEIRVCGNVIDSIVSSLKSYSQLDQANIDAIDIHESIETTLIVLSGLIKQGITIEKKYSKLPKINCFINELNQVWTNIIYNAIQAMEGKGLLIIETKLKQKHIFTYIKDNGPGIESDIIPKIFEAGFTTKPSGTGTGLGLSISKDIIERHGGRIEVESTESGATFTVILPLNFVKMESD